VFFVLVVLPACFAVLNHLGIEPKWEEVEAFALSHPDANGNVFESARYIFDWALGGCKRLFWKPKESDSTFQEHIEKMFTKGGLTERVCLSLLEGKSLRDSLEASFDRCVELVRLNDSLCE